YAYSFPSYYYQGARYVFNIKYTINKYLDFWAYLARTNYFDRNVVSSGLNEINGNHKTDLHLQIRVKF
ncbi:MAG TPA: helix-hairpin-helix domain-containing protein, partial [Bacteroidales bacterium]|nr:helix-hairpin-helix domain-containing protein [Bacteroidales bacterium]